MANDDDLRFAFKMGALAASDGVEDGSMPAQEDPAFQEWMEVRFAKWYSSFQQLKKAF